MKNTNGRGKVKIAIVLSVAILVAFIIAVSTVYPGLSPYCATKIALKGNDTTATVYKNLPEIKGEKQTVKTEYYGIELPTDYKREETLGNESIKYSSDNKFIIISKPEENMKTDIAQSVEDFEKYSKTDKTYAEELFKDNLFEQRVSLYTHSIEDFPIKDKNKANIYSAFLLGKVLVSGEKYSYYENGDLCVLITEFSDAANLVSATVMSKADKQQTYQISFGNMPLSDVLAIVSTVRFNGVTQ